MPNPNNSNKNNNNNNNNNNNLQFSKTIKLKFNLIKELTKS